MENSLHSRLDRFWEPLHNAALKFPEIAPQALPLLLASLPQLELIVVATSYRADGRGKSVTSTG